MLLSGTLGALATQVFIVNEEKKARQYAQESVAETERFLAKIDFDTDYNYIYEEKKADGSLSGHNIYEFTPEWQLVTLYRTTIRDVINDKIYTSGNWTELGTYLTKNAKVPFQETNTIEIEGITYPKIVYGNEEIIENVYDKITERIKEENIADFNKLYVIDNDTFSMNLEKSLKLNLYTYERKNIETKEWERDGNLYLSFKEVTNYNMEETCFQYQKEIDLAFLLEEQRTLK